MHWFCAGVQCSERLQSSELKVIHLPPYASFEVVFLPSKVFTFPDMSVIPRRTPLKTSVQTTSRGCHSQLRLSLRLARLFLENCFEIFFGQGHSKAAERIWGETLNFVWRILGELLGKVALQNICVQKYVFKHFGHSTFFRGIVSLANWFPDLTRNNMKIAVFADVFSGILRGAFPRSPNL